MPILKCKTDVFDNTAGISQIMKWNTATTLNIVVFNSTYSLLTTT